MRLIFTLFALPFWVFLAAAGGVFYLGELSHRDTLAQNQEMARALAGPPPETVSFADFSRQNDVGLADEVSVQAVINPDYNYELTKKRKGRNTTRFLFVLFDAADPEDSKVARGALVLSAAEKARFIDEYYAENAEIGVGASGFVSVVTLNGQAENASDLSSLVNDAFDEQNLVKSDDFIYIEPFLEGRAAGLTPTMSADELRNIIRGVGLVVALIGLVKFALRRRRKTAPAATPQAAFSMEGTGLDAGQLTPAKAAMASTIEPEEAAEQKSKKPFPIKLVAVLALLGVAIYSGQLAYVAIVALVGLQLLAVRKTRHLITGALAKVTGRGGAPETSEDRIMAKVQDAARDVPVPKAAAAGLSDANSAPAKPTRREFPLPFARKGDPQADMSAVSAAPEAQPVAPEPMSDPKRGFSLSLPGLSRRANSAPGEATDTNPAETAPALFVESDKPKRGFALSLPSLRRKPQAEDSGSNATPSLTKAPRKKDAFQAAELFTSDETQEAPGLAGKIQLFMARLLPAERQPKAFADRPDPFEKLASEAQRSGAR